MKKKMYATVRRYEGVPDPAKAAEEVDMKFVPFISSSAGIHGILLDRPGRRRHAFDYGLQDVVGSNGCERKGPDLCEGEP